MARYVEITFEGLNVARTVTVLSKKYLLRNIVKNGRLCKITVDSKDCQKVVAFLKERCYNIIDISKLGWNFVLFFVRKHFFLPIFMLFAVILLFFSSNFCWKIRVSGDYSSSEVLHALESCDVGVGDTLFGFSVDEVENSLCSELDAMYAVVTRKGSVLYVNAVKRKTVDSPIDMHAQRDIIATANGKVKQILCEQGSAVVQVGDYVKKGDLLIEGKRIFNDGTSENVYACGRVLLELSVEAFAKFDGTVTEIKETGNKYYADSVELFGKSYGKLPPFKSYREEITETCLAPLNIKIKHIVYFETCSVTTNVSIDQCLEQLKSQALRQATESADFLVTETAYRITSDGVFATVYGELEIT